MCFQNNQLQGGDYIEDCRAEWRVKISVWQCFQGTADVCWWAGVLGFNSQGEKMIFWNERSLILSVTLSGSSAYPGNQQGEGQLHSVWGGREARVYSSSLPIVGNLVFLKILWKIGIKSRDTVKKVFELRNLSIGNCGVGKGRRKYWILKMAFLTLKNKIVKWKTLFKKINNCILFFETSVDIFYSSKYLQRTYRYEFKSLQLLN